MGYVYYEDADCPVPGFLTNSYPDHVIFTGNYTFRGIIFISTMVCMGLSLCLSLYLIFKHLRRYSAPLEQRQIIRIIFMPALFAAVSPASISFYRYSEYIQPVRYFYTPVAVAALFTLFIEFIAPGLSRKDRLNYFATVKHPKKDKSCVKFYKQAHYVVFFYVFVNIFMTIVQLASETTDRYCESSFSIYFAHFWVTFWRYGTLAAAIVSLSSCCLMFKPLPEFQVHQPLKKLVSVMLLLFLFFIQNLIFSILVATDSISGSNIATGLDIAVGVPELITAVEQVGFAVYFHLAFDANEYQNSELSKRPQMSMSSAMVHALNPIDIIKGVWYMFSLQYGNPNAECNHVVKPAAGPQDPFIPTQNGIQVEQIHELPARNSHVIHELHESSRWV